MHYQAASYSSALEYYRSGLRSTEPTLVATDHARLLRKTADCFLNQGLYEEAERELLAAQDMMARVEDLSELSVIQVRQALVHFRRGHYDRALSTARNAFAELATTDQHREVGNAQMIMGNACVRLGEPDKAKEFFQDALATYRRIEEPIGQAQAFQNLAIVAKNECRWSKALDLYDRAKRIIEEQGNSYALLQVLSNMGWLYRKIGRRAEAMALVERGLELGRNLGDQRRLTLLKLLMGVLQTEDGKYPAAESSLLEARVMSERRKANRELALVDEFLGDLMTAQGRYAEAEMNYQLAEKRAAELGTPNDVQAEVLRRRAFVALQQKDYRAAIDLAEKGIEVAESCGERFELPYMHRTVGCAYFAQDKLEEAGEGFDRALSLFQGHRLPTQVRDVLVDLARLHLAMGGDENLLVARGRLREALRHSSPDTDTVPCEIHLTLARVELELGNFDEAILALYEIERLACAAEADFNLEVQTLREQIEAAVSHQAQDASSQYQVLADLPDLLSVDDPNLSQNLRSMVVAVAERLRAERGFLAVWGTGDKLHVLSTLGLNRSRARQIAGHVHGELSRDGSDSLRVWTHPQADDQWRQSLGDTVDEIGSALALPVMRDNQLRGLLYLDRSSRAQSSVGFNKEAIAVAASYVEVLKSAIVDAVDDLQEGTRGRSGSFLWEEAFENIITESDAMVEVLSLCSKVAASPYTVLFSGETGTGKGLLAYALHRLSPRREESFVSVNCAAIPESLLESELFGHVKGSFTGADRDRDGLIRTADGGTLFLDEVGKMSLPMQAKLLLFLDNREVRPVGGSHSQTVDVRILCASKRGLKTLVDLDLFLEDLYYRLLDFPIHVPPLRDRADDILLLARHYVERTAVELNGQPQVMTRAFMAQLRAYAWPGNVRELEKTIKRTVIMAGDDDRLRLRHLPASLLAGGPVEVDDDPQAVHPLKAQVAEFERGIIQHALNAAGWNRSEAARRLRISYPTLLQKIKLYNLKSP